MNVSDTIQLRLSTATALTDLTEDRIFPVTPTEGTQLPFVVHTITGTEPVNTLDGQVSLTKYTVDVDVYAVNYDAVQDIQAVVKSLLNNYRAGIIQDSTLVSLQSTPTEDGYSGTQTYQVWADEGTTAHTASISVGPDDVTLAACDHTLTLGCDGLVLEGGVFTGDGGGLTNLPPPQLPDNLAYTDQANMFTQPQTVVGEGENEPTTELGGGFVNITNGSNGGGISGSGGSWSGANVSIEVQKIPGGNSTVITPDAITTQGTITTVGAVMGGSSDAPAGPGKELVLAPTSGGTTGILFQHNGVSSTYLKSDGGNLRLGNGSGDRVVVGYASPAHVSLTVQGTTGQTADLIRCQNSTGTAVVRVGLSPLGSTSGRLELVGNATADVVVLDGENGININTYSETRQVRFASGTGSGMNAGLTWGGDNLVKVTDGSTGLGTIAANGVVLTSPGGTRYRIQVANDGTLSTTAA